MTVATFCNNAMDLYSIQFLLHKGQVGVVKLILGLIYLLEGFLIISWIKLQERRATGGDNNAVKSVIFPVFVLMLWINAWVNLYIAFVTIFVQRPVDDMDSIASIIAYSLINALERFVIEGVALLLLEKGMGVYSAKQCFKKVGVWSVITFVVTALSYSNPSFGEGLYQFWNFSLVIFYMVLWLAPRHNLFRRPALILYAKFWFFFQLFLAAIRLLQLFPSTDAIGACGYTFGEQFLLALLEPIVVYSTLLRDCRWWQGLNIEADSTVIDQGHHRSIQERSQKQVAQRDLLAPGDGEAISSPLAGVDLKLDSAQQLADTMDQISKESGVKLLNFAYIRLNTRKLLGRGSFSNVYRGRYKDRDCAIKLVYTMDLTVDTIKRIAAEAEILSCIKNPNIVEIFGVAVLPPSVCILLELCRYGSLGDVLRGKESEIVAVNSSVKSGRLHLSTPDLLFLALGCARGIAALHRYQGVCHRDIKSFNFLVDGQLNAKVADLELGVSKSAVKGFYRKRNQNANVANPLTGGTLSPNNASLCAYIFSCDTCCTSGAGEAGPKGRRDQGEDLRSSLYTDIRESVTNALAIIEPIEEAGDLLANWAAPEFIKMGTYTQASDIYSLGLVLWEIVSRKLPFEKEMNQDTLRIKIVQGVRPKLPSDLMPELGKLIRSMWQSDAASRPKAKDVVITLERLWKNYFHTLVKLRTVPLADFEKNCGVEPSLIDDSIDAASIGRSSALLSYKGNRSERAGGISHIPDGLPTRASTFRSSALPDQEHRAPPAAPSVSVLDEAHIVNTCSILEKSGGGTAVNVNAGNCWGMFSQNFPHGMLRSTPSFFELFGEGDDISDSIISMLVDESDSSTNASNGSKSSEVVNDSECIRKFIAALSRPECYHCMLKLKKVKKSVENIPQFQRTNTNTKIFEAMLSTAWSTPTGSGGPSEISGMRFEECVYSVHCYPVYTGEPISPIREDISTKKDNRVPMNNQQGASDSNFRSSVNPMQSNRTSKVQSNEAQASVARTPPMEVAAFLSNNGISSHDTRFSQRLFSGEGARYNTNQLRQTAAEAPSTNLPWVMFISFTEVYEMLQIEVVPTVSASDDDVDDNAHHDPSTVRTSFSIERQSDSISVF